MARRRRSRWLEGGALVIGLLGLGLWSRAVLRSWAFQSTESRKLATATSVPEAGPALIPSQEKRATPPGARAPTKAKASKARVASLGRIEIPRLGVRAMVAEGTDARTLDLAVGHIAATARPGSPGNCGLAGHRDTFFRGLEGVRAGDRVSFTTPGRTYTYQVEWSRVVEPDRVDTLEPTKVPSLTLVTCYPFTFVGRAPKRFVVRARQVGAVEAPVAGRVRGKGLTADAVPVLMASGR